MKITTFFKKKDESSQESSQNSEVAAITGALPSPPQNGKAAGAAAPKRQLPSLKAVAESPPLPSGGGAGPSGTTVGAPSHSPAPVAQYPAPLPVAAPAPPAAATASIRAAPPAAAAAKAPAPDVVWLWQSGPTWTPYSSEQSAAIERAYAAGEPRAPLDAGRHIDLGSMRQVRDDNPSRSRKVKRDGPPLADPSGASLTPAKRAATGDAVGGGGGAQRPKQHDGAGGGSGGFDVDDDALAAIDIDAAIAQARQAPAPAAAPSIWAAASDAPAASASSFASSTSGSSGSSSGSGAASSGQAPAAAAAAPYDGGARGEWHERLRAAFLVPVGDDAFELYDVARKLKPAAPHTAFRAAGLEMLGPLRMLAGQLPSPSPLSDRDVYHPAEFQPLLRVGGGSGDAPAHTFGYWCDDPSAAATRLVVLCKPLPPSQSPGAGFSLVADSVLAAAHNHVANEARKGGLRQGELKRLVAALEEAAQQAGLPLDALGDKSAAARARKKATVASLSNKMGVVVPYEKDTELGWRELHLTGNALRKLLKQIVESDGAAKATHQSELDDLVNWATIANDEGDFGASLQLGQDLFNHSPRFAPLAARILNTSYTLLGRTSLARIAAMHGKQRNA